MTIITEKDYWIEATIREVSTQAHFAGIAFKNINKKSTNPTDTVFSSIHSFLSHCAMVSKMLLSEYRVEMATYTKVLTVGHVLKISVLSDIHKRKFRNHLEHYDERLKNWVKRHARGENIGTYNIGPKSEIGSNLIFVSHYDPESKVYTFVDEDLELQDLYEECERIKELANEWVSKMQLGVIMPPYN